MRGMMLRDKADFTGGLAGPVDDQMEFDEWMVVERLGQSTAGFVVTDDADEYATHAKRDEVACDIAGASNHQLGALDGDNRCRRLGRYAGNLAVDKLVQHQIANAKDGLLIQRGKLLVKIVHGPTGSDRLGRDSRSRIVRRQARSG